jgi:hypothetical protein
MLDQLFEEFRKASESSLQVQQDMFRHWAQQWQTVTPNAAGMSSEWGRTFQKRWVDLTLEALKKHRESLDSVYQSGINLIEQSLRASEAKSQEDFSRVVEDLWRKVFDTLKGQSEAQFRDFRAWAEKSFEMARAADGRNVQNSENRPQM